MQVENLLPTVLVAVDQQAIAIGGNAEFPCQVACHQEQSTHQWRIGIGDVVDGRDGLVGYDQDVHRRARVNVAKGGDFIVLIHDVRRYFAGHDAFE